MKEKKVLAGLEDPEDSHKKLRITRIEQRILKWTKDLYPHHESTITRDQLTANTRFILNEKNEIVSSVTNKMIEELELSSLSTDNAHDINKVYEGSGNIH